MKSLSDIVDNIHKNESTGLTKDQIATVAKAIFGNIATTLTAGEEVRVNNFGGFSVKEREARMGRNPATGASLQIAASKNVKFKASKVLSDGL